MPNLVAGASNLCHSSQAMNCGKTEGTKLSTSVFLELKAQDFEFWQQPSIFQFFSLFLLRKKDCMEEISSQPLVQDLIKSADLSCQLWHKCSVCSTPKEDSATHPYCQNTSPASCCCFSFLPIGSNQLIPPSRCPLVMTSRAFAPKSQD